MYRTLRVDHLEPGELDYELLLRNIAIADDESRCKRRRRLREVLKQEREGHEHILEFDHDPEIDLDHCLIVFQQIKRILESKDKNSSHCKARLLHLGHRLTLIRNHCSEELTAKCSEAYQEVISLFSEHFWSEHSFFADDDSSTSSDSESQQGACALNPSSVPYTGTKPKRARSKFVTKLDFTSAMKEVADLFSGLTTEIRELKSELKSRKSSTTSELDISDFLVEPLVTSRQKIDDTNVPPAAGYPRSRSSTCVTTAINESIPFPAPSSTHSTRISQSNQIPVSKLNTTNPFLLDCPMDLPQPIEPTRCEPTVKFTVPQTPIHEGVPQPASVYQPSGCINSQYNVAASYYPRWSESEAPPPVEHRSVSDATFARSYPTAPLAQSNLPTGTGNLHGYQQERRQPVADATFVRSYPNVQIAQSLPTGHGNPHFYQEERRQPVVHPRKVIPVSQWKIQKYKADDQGLGMNEFLENVNQMALSEHVSEEDLFDSAIHLFDGPALSWYTAMRSQNRLRDWRHLIQELQKAFRHPDLDAVLRVKIYQYRQQRNETFQQYYLHMEKLFRSMSQPMSEPDKIEVIKMNLRFDYRKLLVGRRITSLQTLINLGNDLDAADSSAFARVFGNPKKETCALTSDRVSPQHTRVFSNKHQYTGKTNQFTKPDKNSKGYPNSKSAKTEPKNSEQPKAKTEVDPPRREARGAKDPFSKMVSNYRPPPQGECFNCRDDHDTGNCPLPRRLFCPICAFPGVVYKSCPYCSKNSPRES